MPVRSDLPRLRPEDERRPLPPAPRLDDPRTGRRAAARARPRTPARALRGRPGSPAACLPALSTGTTDETWRLLGRISSAQDLLSGLRIEVRRQGEPAAPASWTHPVVASPEVLCKGLAVQLRAGTEIAGRLSAFIEQTHFVELAREPTLPELTTRRSEFDFQGIEPRVYETSQTGRRFALVLGPLDRERAQAPAGPCSKVAEKRT